MLSARKPVCSCPGRASEPITSNRPGSSISHGGASDGAIPTMSQPSPSEAANNRSSPTETTATSSPESSWGDTIEARRSGA